MFEYVLRLLILLPLVGGMAFGALWLWRKVQPGMVLGQRERAVKLIDAVPLGATTKLAVVEFDSRQLLIAVTRGRVDLLAANGPGSDD